MAALRVGRLDLGKRRAVICESVTVVPGHGLLPQADIIDLSVRVA
jgi:hypothetical protein